VGGTAAETAYAASDFFDEEDDESDFFESDDDEEESLFDESLLLDSLFSPPSFDDRSISRLRRFVP